MTSNINTNHKVQYLSPNQKALNRLKRNKVAMFGLFVIVFAVFLAIFGYAIAPDKTPQANEQVLEIATETPGFSISMLRVHKNKSIAESNIFGFLMGGKENAYRFIPITSYKVEGNYVLIEKYMGKKVATESDTITLVDALYPIKQACTFNTDGGTCAYTKLAGETEHVSAEVLQQQFKDKHLVTNKTYYLGTDKFGRDNLSRLILGVRVSLSVGLMAVFISLLIGITVGATAGYFRGWVDDVAMWLINVFWSIPLLLLVFALILVLGRKFWQIYLAVGLTMWVEVARIVRGQIISLREKEFVEAAYSMGFKHWRIIVRHILPNTVGPVVVITAANFATAIIIEAGLSFLGIGVQPPAPSWGTMLNEYYGYLGTSKAFLAMVPSVAILILVLAFNLLGNGLRDALDVKTKG